jgi:hypothetical protein
MPGDTDMQEGLLQIACMQEKDLLAVPLDRVSTTPTVLCCTVPRCEPAHHLGAGVTWQIRSLSCRVRPSKQQAAIISKKLSN